MKNNNYEGENNTMNVDFVMTTKEVKKFGRAFGYGVTMGVFSALCTINIGIGIYKAIKKVASKKFTEEDLKESEQMTDEEEEKKAEEFFKEN